MKRRRYHVIVLAVALAFLAVALVLKRPWATGPALPKLEPLAVIPPGAVFVLDIDLARLRASPDGVELSRLGLERFAAAPSSDAFQPLRDVDSVVVAAPGNARLHGERRAAFEPDAVAVVATGRFSGPAVADAATASIRARGGDPIRTKLGTFESVRDLRGTGEVAARDGLLVLSDGAYLRAVLAAAEGHRNDGSDPERARDRVHAELRRTFRRGAPIMATLTLPEGTLEAALGDPELSKSPLAAVRSAALRVGVAKNLEADGLLVCSSVERCSDVAAFLRDLRPDLEDVLDVDAGAGRIAELGRQDRERVTFALSVSLSAIARLLDGK